jgi:hypothetical protein
MVERRHVVMQQWANHLNPKKPDARVTPIHAAKRRGKR